MEKDTEFVCSRSNARISSSSSVITGVLTSNSGTVKPTHEEHDMNGLQRSLHPRSSSFPLLLLVSSPSQVCEQQFFTLASSSESHKAKSNIGAAFSSIMCKSNNIEANLTIQKYQILMIQTKTPLFIKPIFPNFKGIQSIKPHPLFELKPTKNACNSKLQGFVPAMIAFSNEIVK